MGADRNNSSSSLRPPPGLLVGECPLLAAGSTGRRNTGVESICRRLERQGLARSFIELAGHPVQVCLGVDRQVRPLGEVLPQQAIGVLVGAALPGALRIAEVPFGGYKQSGWGREMGQAVLSNYLEIKAITSRIR